MLTPLLNPPRYFVDPFEGIELWNLWTLFDRARLLVLARAWDAIPEVTTVHIALPTRGIADGCAWVWGDADGPRGVAFFRSYDEYRMFVETTEQQARDGIAHGPPGAALISIDFYARDELHPAMIAIVRAKALKLADPDSYPIPTVIAADGSEPPLTGEDVELCSAVLVALASLALDDRGPLGETPTRIVLELDDDETAIVECPHPRSFADAANR